jgi:sugar-specific transcriptional regulator TrmB
MMGVIKILDNEILISEMKKIGFTTYEAKAYIGLVKKNPVTRYELSQISGIPQSKIYEVIKTLVAKGIVLEIENDPTLYIPYSPDEFICEVSKDYSETFHYLKKGLKQIGTSSFSSYIWNLNQYETIISKAKDIAEDTIQDLFVYCWLDEFNLLMPVFETLYEKKVKITVVGYGVGDFAYGRIFKHGTESNILAERGRQLIVVNENAMLMSVLTNSPHGLWTKSKDIIQIYKEFILHEVYLWKIINQFSRDIYSYYGEKLEGLTNLDKF